MAESPFTPPTHARRADSHTPGTNEAQDRERVKELREAARLLTPTVQHPEEVAAVIAEFQEFTDQEYQRALADNLLAEDPVETAAFHSDELVERTLLAAVHLVKSTNAALVRRAGESAKQWERRAGYFRTVAGVERRRAQTIVDGLRARQGRVSNAPNPRARAARELQKRHAEEFVLLVRKHEREIIEEGRAKKAAKKAAQRSMR